jgi:16S rRNA (cytosine967-C5)-methyltransferase
MNPVNPEHLAASEAGVSAARRAAYEVLRRVFEQGAWADRALPAAARRYGLAGRDRALAQRLAYGAVQRRGTSDHLIALLAERPPEALDPHLLAALRLGLYELLYAGGTPDHAAVDQAVALAKGQRPRRGSGLVNAVLRRAARERDSLLSGLDDSTPASAAIAHSVPLWLAEMWWAELGPDAARAVMAASNEPAETALRVNTLRAEPGEAVASLRAAGIEARRPDAAEPLNPPESLVADGALAAAADRISSGELVPQSRASAGVVALLGPRTGERILDLCGGPGVKASQIAARMRNSGRVVSVEADAARAAQTRELCKRLGATCVEVVHGDARSDHGGGYDRVLVDPPCSDLGTLASRPDARWRKSREQIAGLASLQAEILRRGAASLRPGGTLVYSTCTISATENEAVAADAALEPDDLGVAYPTLASAADSRFLQTMPDRDATDGFFIARFKSAEG